MNILFCCEGFIIDGVASFNLHLSASLVFCGHKVAILGRWLGNRGYQKRYHEAGVEVLQYLSHSVVSGRAIELAREFAPDVVITDGRRAFPLSMEIHRRLGIPVVTNFIDTPCGKDKPGRTMQEVHDNSVAWVSNERLQIDEMKKLSPSIHVRLIKRAVSPVLMPPAPMPGRDPFHVLCMGRLSGYKCAGPAAVVRGARRLLSRIPSLRVTIVGGGWRKAILKRDAVVANLASGKRFVRVMGYQLDPSPWVIQSTIVVGGSSCGMEAILSNRPLIAVSGHWYGLVTPENLMEADDCFYAERGGKFYIKDNPDVVLDEIINVYENWNDSVMLNSSEALRKTLSEKYSPEAAVRDWEQLFADVL